MFYTLQSFRGLAAVAVAAFHLSIGLGDQRFFGFKVFEEFTWRMNLGVDFFFVLSGFIIMAAHKKDIGHPSRLVQFLQKRFFRIYPIYWLCTGIFCALIALGLGSTATNPDTAVKWISVVSLVRLDNFLLPISPAWTLIHEVAFYAVFSILIINRKVGIIAFTFWLVPCLLLFNYPTPYARTPFITYFSAYNLDFTIGMGAYLMLQKRILRNPLIGMGTGFCALYATLFAENSGGGGSRFTNYFMHYRLAYSSMAQFHGRPSCGKQTVAALTFHLCLFLETHHTQSILRILRLKDFLPKSCLRLFLE